MKVEVTGKDRIHDGFFKVDRVHFRYQKFDGTMSEPLSHEVVDRGESVAVLLYDPAADLLGLIRQFRLGPCCAKSDDHPWTLEIVSGNCDGSTDYQAVARRETREETGWPVLDLRLINRFFMSPSGSTELVYLFLGLFDSRTPPQGGGGLRSENEDIETLLLSFAAAMQSIENGHINSAHTILALQWLAIHRPRLRSE